MEEEAIAESSFVKGSSSLELLHALVLRLQKVEMEVGLKLHLILVTGTQMIAQGTDRLSQGMLCKGVMARRDMLDYVDIAQSSTSRQPTLTHFMCKWTGIKNLSPLQIDDLFVRGHGIVVGEKDKHEIWVPSHATNGWVYWWDPPPGMAEVVLEEALKARRK